MAVEVRREAAHEPPECLDLVPHLEPRLVRARALGLRARVAHELVAVVQQRGHPLGIRERRAQGEVHVEAHAEPRGLQLLELGRIGAAVDHEGRAGHDALGVAVENAAAHPARQAEVVRVDDEDAAVASGRAHFFPITRRK
jgi:hypothetical protein